MPKDLKSNLNLNQEKALLLCVQGKTYTEIAEILNIDRSTLHRWIKDSEFKAELNRVKNSITKTLWFKQKELLNQSIAILADELKNKDSKHRVKIALNIVKSFQFQETNFPESRFENIQIDTDL